MTLDSVSMRTQSWLIMKCTCQPNIWNRFGISIWGYLSLHGHVVVSVTCDTLIHDWRRKEDNLTLLFERWCETSLTSVHHQSVKTRTSWGCNCWGNACLPVEGLMGQQHVASFEEMIYYLAGCWLFSCLHLLRTLKLSCIPEHLGGFDNKWSM